MSLVGDVVALVVAALVLIGLVGLGTLIAVILYVGPNEKSDHEEPDP